MDTTNGCVEVIARAQGELRLEAALTAVADAAFGGIAVFVGKVRDRNLGRAVTGISYDLFVPLALATFARALDAAAQSVGTPLRGYVGHASGRLGIGDTAVIVAIATPHRDAAFRACRAVIEAVKHEAPIWKQEHYADGDSAWSEGCALCVAAGHELAANDAAASAPEPPAGSSAHAGDAGASP